MSNTLTQLHHTKLLLSSVVLVVTGILLIVLANQLEGRQTLNWLGVIPWSELGGILIGGGLLSVWLDHYLRREQAAIDELRLRQLLREQAPAMRDAVLEVFAANHGDLVRVATPQMLDQVITNSLALRLHDQQFAGEIYRDIRDQAISATERWHDALLSIDLAPQAAPETSKRRAPTSEDTSYFTVTVRWEYTAIPTHAQRRFICVSDRDEYTELVHERGAVSAWYLKPHGGLSANDKAAFELLRFSVNGQDRPIRRSERKDSQTYTATVGAEHVRAGQPVTISYTYTTLTKRSGHLLFFDIEQPTRDLRVDFNYVDCDIATISTLDLIPSIRPTRIEQNPPQLPPGTIRVDLDGWIFPRSGIAFVWTLKDEEAGVDSR